MSIHPSTQHRDSWLCALLRAERKHDGKARVVVFVKTETTAFALHERLRKHFPSAVNAGQHAADGLARFREGKRLVLVTPDGRMPAATLLAQGAVCVSWDPPSSMNAHTRRVRMATGAAVRVSYHPLLLYNQTTFEPRLNAAYAHELVLELRRRREQPPPTLVQVAAVSEAAKALRVAQEQEAARNREAERQQAEEDTRVKKRREAEGRLAEVRTKRLHVGDRVTALGLSTAQGDLVIRSIGSESGIVHVHGGQAGILEIKDPRTLSSYEEPGGPRHAFDALALPADHTLLVYTHRFYTLLFYMLLFYTHLVYAPRIRASYGVCSRLSRRRGADALHAAPPVRRGRVRGRSRPLPLRMPRRHLQLHSHRICTPPSSDAMQ